MNISSITVSWQDGGNPAGTLYEINVSSDLVDLSVVLSSYTTNQSQTFTNLQADVTYYAQVRAINHSGLPTGFLTLGSTQTLRPQTLTWIGGVSNDWSLAANWDYNLTPRHGDGVIVQDGAPFDPLFVSSITLSSLSLATGSDLTLQGATVTVSGAYSSLGTLTVRGDENLAFNSGFDVDSGTVVYNGSATYARLAAGSDYYNVIMSGTGTHSLTSDLYVHKNIALVPGVLSANGFDIYLNGVGAQTVDANGSSVESFQSLNTSASGVTFASSFTAVSLNLNTGPLVGAATMYFAAGATFTVTTLDINGTALFRAALRSTVPGTAFVLTVPTGTVVSYVDVRDSYASFGG